MLCIQKISKSILLFLALTAGYAHAAPYMWSAPKTGSGGPYPYSSPADACETLTVGGETWSLGARKTETSFYCGHTNADGKWFPTSFYISFRGGDGCNPGDVYNPANGQCETPKDCSSHKGKSIFAGVSCTATTSGIYATPDHVTIDGAEYVSRPGGGPQRVKQDFDGSGNALCVARYEGTGQCLAPTEGSPDLSEGTYADATPAEPNQPECLEFDGKNLCLSPDNAGCDIYNGNPWCYQSGDNCGEVNGEFRCLPNTARQCTYVDGKMECIETGNPKGSKPPKYIPPTSPDHPTNGGNADGRDDNDPLPPGTTGGGGGGSGQGSNDAATNKSIQEVGDKIDGTNDLLTDIKDGLIGEPYDNSGDGNDADSQGAGEQAGTGIGDSITEKTGSILEERETESQEYLESLPDKVEDWFGSGGENVGLTGIINTIVPTSAGCSDYIIDASLDKYSSKIVIPGCELTRVKPLLEWVIWCVTLIGLWKILYSSLRQDDVKASKGGF